MPFVAKVTGLWQTPELKTQWDGQYLVAYDEGDGVNADYVIHTTTDISKAERYATSLDVEAERYKVPDPARAWRLAWHEATPNNELWRFALEAVSVPS